MGDQITEETNKILSDIYYDLKNPESFSTLDRLFKAVKGKISKQEIKKWLGGQLTYTLHKPRRKNFTRNYYEVDNIDDNWESDLIDIASLAKYNDNYKYILIIIDVFSKFVFAKPMKTKSAKEVTENIKRIIEESGRKPIYFLNDRGKEYENNTLNNYFKEIGVKHILPSNDISKACVAERVIRSFKEILFKLLTSTLSYRYIDKIEEITALLNKRYHRTIGRRPVDVNPENILEVWRYVKQKRLKSEKKKKEKKQDALCVNMFVRVSKRKNDVGDKMYLPNWSDEIFKIYKVIPHKIPVYKLKDLENEVIEGIFYAHELQPITYSPDTLHRIDKILKQRKRNGVTQYLVSWRGYKKTSWIDATALIGESDGDDG
jgi:hypothetical protein